jgi:uncharacterized membrane protein (UPF0127 family)
MKLRFLDILKEGEGYINYPFKNTKTISITNENGEEVNINCELALSPEEKAQGLLHRKDLCENCGVLFDGGGDYHMIGMEFPIEMIFIDGNEIVDIVKANPGDQQISPNSTYTKNLEVNDGFTKKNNISIGNILK